MSKSLLVIDTPNCCKKCELLCDLGDWICMGSHTHREIKKKERSENSKPDWCPLHPFPEQRNESDTYYESDYYRAQGWNSCIDEICGV